MGTTTYNTKGVGGLGGYTYGETIKDASKLFEAGKVIYIYVGGTGAGWNSGVGPWSGGWNGGGTCYGGASGGGGATDIRLTLASTTDNTAWNTLASLKSRIMVAGGGGGSNDISYAGCGGNQTGGSGVKEKTTDTAAGTGGSQTAGGSNYGLFGYGNYPGTSHSDGGAGGGGYYGGGRATGNGATGGGGSSFISGHTGCNAIKEGTTVYTGGTGNHLGTPNHYSGYTFTNTSMIQGGKTMPDPISPHGTNKAGYVTSGTRQNNCYGKEEKGYARITLKPYD